MESSLAPSRHAPHPKLRSRCAAARTGPSAEVSWAVLKNMRPACPMWWILVDQRREIQRGFLECRKLDIPTGVDAGTPTAIPISPTWPIPCNDDACAPFKLVLVRLADAISMRARHGDSTLINGPAKTRRLRPRGRPPWRPPHPSIPALLPLFSSPFLPHGLEISAKLVKVTARTPTRRQEMINWQDRRSRKSNGDIGPKADPSGCVRKGSTAEKKAGRNLAAKARSAATSHRCRWACF